LLGPGLNKAGKFPTAMGAGEDVADKVEGAKASVKFQLKSKKSLCMGVAVGHIKMKQADLVQNINLAINFLVSLLPKHWQQIKRLYLKSTQGAPHRIYGF
jgi:large subunit ribosomal protein L10Ae